MNDETYQKLDHSALWLVLGEFGGAALLLVLLLLMLVANLISSGSFSWGYQTGQIIALVIGLVYGLAYLGNLVMAVMGLYLYVSEKREGLPGTGHLLNWILIATTLVPALILIAAAFASM